MARSRFVNHLGYSHFVLLMKNAVLRTDGQVSGWVSVSFSLDVYLVADLLMFEELQVYFPK